MDLPTTSAKVTLAANNQYLLGSATLFCNLIDERNWLPDAGLDAIRELAFVAKNLGGVGASDDEGKAFLLVKSLRID